MKNLREEVPFAHYAQRFRALSSAEVCRRLPDVRWDGKEFYVNLLGREYAISHPEAVLRAEEGALPPGAVRTFLLRYLLEGRDLPATGNWKTFREMPWGDVYAPAFAGRAVNRAAHTFGAHVAAFCAAAEKMGAQRLAHGDAGYEFTFLSGYKMRLLVWEGDEDFPPNAQLLFSDNFASGFTAEDRVVAGDILIQAIKSIL